MESPSTLLRPVCERLIDLAIEEYTLLRNLREEVESLKSRTSLIKAVLRDAEEKEASDEAIHVWLRQLKHILLDAEDIFDEAATNAHLRKIYRDGPELKTKVRDIFCCFRCVQRISCDRDMACRIKAIRLKLDRLYDEKNKLGLQISVPKEYRHARSHTCSLLDAEGSYFSGRDEEREKIIQVLLTSKEVVETNVHTSGVKILIIHGIGGVGKTTLAKLIFSDPRVKEHFQLMIWVCVSEDFDLKRITREIMDVALSFEERRELLEIANWDLQQRKFKEKIEVKRFLLVLDDLWEEDSSKWNTLFQSLVHGEKGSKIMVTTRNQKTLKMVNNIPFPLGVMSNDDLWLILRRYAFGNEEPSGKMQLEIVGRQIVEKLKGLPLAARVIGGLLNESLDVNHWTYIRDSEIFTSQRYDILSVLKLSFDHLSMNLKQCFTYCSLFPKDYIFSKDELILMWIAQNFIANTTDLYLERVGHENFEELLNKSFFEIEVRVGRENFDDLFDKSLFEIEVASSKSFKIHDLIHDLAQSISKDDCFRLGDSKHKQMSENVRHVSITTDRFDLSKLMAILNHENLRTLVFLHENTFQLMLPLDDLFVKLKRLRILGLRRCKIEQLPSSIGKLKHLRFADLSENMISNLPDSMSNLHNLQVLKLKGCRRLSALPRNTSALVNLRHLELDTELASHVQELRKLTALQKLIITGSKVGELANMSMLKEIRIWSLECVASQEEAIQARLEAKKHLEMLELKWSRDDEPRQQPVPEEEVVDSLKPANSIRHLSVTCYEGARSPKWMGDPSWISTSLLEKLDLHDCMNWEVLPPLSQLPGLKFLRISGISGVRRIGPEFFSCCDDGRGGGGVGGVKLTPGFPSLEVLSFSNMSEWEEWESPPVVEEQQQQHHHHHYLLFFPRLRTLELRNCPKLRQLPPLPPTLTTLDLENVGMTHLPRWMMPLASSSSPSLSSLKISDCPNLTSLDHGLLQHPDLWMLKKLEIDSCYELVSLPDGLFQHLDSLEQLRVKWCPMLSWGSPSSGTEEDTALLPSSLKDIRLYQCGDLTGELLLLGGGLSKLASLSKLELDVSSSATLVGLGALTSLTHLGIQDCGDHVDDRSLSTCLQGLTSLKSLSISYCSAVTTLAPLLPGLENLSTRCCAELRSLGCSSLVSFRSLNIDNCPKLLHLVEGGGGGAAAVISSSPSAPPSPAIPSTLVAAKISVESLLVSQCSSQDQIASWLRQVSSLQKVSFLFCQLGDGIDGELEGALLDLAPSLRSLQLYSCYNLSSLPPS